MHPDQCTIDWLLATDEPATRWVTLTQLLGRPDDDPAVQAPHRAVVADSGTADLVARLGDWDNPTPLSGHDSPMYAPNVLSLLADMGMRAGDNPIVDAAVASLLHHQDEAGGGGTPAGVSRIGPGPALAPLAPGGPPSWGG